MHLHAKWLSPLGKSLVQGNHIPLNIAKISVLWKRILCSGDSNPCRRPVAGWRNPERVSRTRSWRPRSVAPADRVSWPGGESGPMLGLSWTWQACPGLRLKGGFGLRLLGPSYFHFKKYPAMWEMKSNCDSYGGTSASGNFQNTWFVMNLRSFYYLLCILYVEACSVNQMLTQLLPLL